MANLTKTLELLSRLIGFDTTSSKSNLALVDWIEDQLTPLGFSCRRIPNSDGRKSNLWARIGPDHPGGLVLSGHTDVVPVVGQPWESDPFQMIERKGLLYGRGTCDMKAFIALCLAFAPRFAELNLKRPIHFAFSYDEEVGCQGAPSMIKAMVEEGAAPDAVWVGEPTLWEVVSGHKGIMLTEVLVRGKEAHSSLPNLGISANGVAIDLLAILRDIDRKLSLSGDPESPFEPPYPTLTIGEIAGGTATNILARECVFKFDLRCPPGFDAAQILEPFFEAAATADEELRSRYPECGVHVSTFTNVPPLAPGQNSPAETLARLLTGDNALRAVAYATEAGQFSQADMPAIICGPGSIEQAHKPNEFVARSEIERGVEIFSKLISHLS